MTNQPFAQHLNDFEGVISNYSPVLFRVALRRLRNVEDAEDAVQDALLSAYKHISQFEGRSQLSTWLTSIVTNTAGMKLRQHLRHEMVSLDQNQENDGATFANKLKDSRPNPETICAQKETHETLRRAVARLSPKLREAIQMRDLDGFSMQETANALGISINALKSRVARGRATLSLLLHEITAASQAAEPVEIRTDLMCRPRRSPEHRGVPAATEALAILQAVV
jgi:RNA polymerase sigma-70 factor (ECF subfamily)